MTTKTGRGSSTLAEQMVLHLTPAVLAFFCFSFTWAAMYWMEPSRENRVLALCSLCLSAIPALRCLYRLSKYLTQARLDGLTTLNTIKGLLQLYVRYLVICIGLVVVGGIARLCGSSPLAGWLAVGLLYFLFVVLLNLSRESTPRKS